MRAFVLALVAIVGVGSAFTPARFARTAPKVAMSAEADSRREFLSKVSVAAAGLAPLAANARIDYEGVKYLGGGDQIDLNNANVRAYLRLPGMYPSIAGKIVSNKKPLKSVGDVYAIKGLTEKEKAILKSYESKGKFVVTEPAAEYVIDRINNGLYR